MSRVCVHGLGYVGLPTAAMLATHGHDVYGYDVDEEIRERLRRGDVHVDEPGLQSHVSEAVEDGNLTATDEVVRADYHVVCVPTPLSRDEKRADLSAIEAAGEGIRSRLEPGDAVVLESTVPPRTTEDVLRPILEESGLEAGTDFALAFCPETVLPGNVMVELRENDRIVGAIDEDAAQAALSLYETFVEGEVRVAPDTTTAEFVKLIQNTYRDTNIALANEVAKLAADYDVDSRDAIELANDHPRVDLHEPGPGVGGHCIPIDPWFLGQRSDSLDLIARAREINDGMVEYVADRLAVELPRTTDVKIAVLGAAYKGNVGDVRQSPGLALARTLQSGSNPAREVAATDGGNARFRDVTVAVNDPHVEDQTLALSSMEEALTGAEATVITTDHDEYGDLDPTYVADRMAGDYLLDTKGILDLDRWNDSPLTVRRI